jgi:hypothetical protein
MTRMSIRFHAAVVVAEGLATDDEGDYFDGGVEFDLVVDGTVHRSLVARVKQAAESQFADPLEVLAPSRYVGPLHYGRYRQCVEGYVRDQVTARVRAGHEGDRNLRLYDLRLPAEASCDLGTIGACRWA